MFDFLSNLFDRDKKTAPSPFDPPDRPPSVFPRPPMAASPNGGRRSDQGGGSLFDFLNPFRTMTSMRSALGADAASAEADGLGASFSASEPQPAESPLRAAQPKNTPEQVKAAEASRDGIKEEVDKLGDLTPKQKERILARTHGLTGDALVTEMAAIRNALAGKNGDRALATYADLDEMMETNPEAKQRLSPEMVSMLVGGVANSRTDSDRGQAGVLGAKQARDSARTLLEMSPEELSKTQKLLDQAGTDESGKPKPGADKGAEQALILKAVAARRDRFDHGGVNQTIDWFKDLLGVESESARAAKELDDFAKNIRGLNRDDLIQSTTVLDIDDKNTSKLDPQHGHNRSTDENIDNDGLFQRFTTSCGPTTAQMVKGEVDPAYALKLRKNSFYDPDPDSELAREQKETLEASFGVAVTRIGPEAKLDASKKIAELKKNKELSDEQESAIDELFSGNKLEGDQQKKAQEALDALRAKNDGHPTDAEIAAIRADKGKVESGMVLPPALNDIAGDSSHIKYAAKGFGTSVTPEKLENVDGLLKDGQQVPIRIAGSGNVGHFMMVSDVRPNPEPEGGRQYLVSDPFSGATRWVPEADFKSGAFTTKQFDLGTAEVTTFFADKAQSI